MFCVQQMLYTDVCNRCCTQMFVIVPKQKQPKCPSDEWIHKSWHIHTIDDYSVKKRNEVQTNIIRMSLENIMLSERSQSQRTTYCMIPFL